MTAPKLIAGDVLFAVRAGNFDVGHKLNRVLEPRLSRRDKWASGVLNYIIASGLRQGRTAGSKHYHLTFSSGESAGLSVSGTSGQFYRFGKVHSHFTGRMGVRAKGDRHAQLGGHLDDLPARVDLFAIFAEAGGV
jgi:hypothetical protein